MNASYGQGTLVARSGNLSRRSVVVSLGFGGVAAAIAAGGWTVETRAQDMTPAAGGQPAQALNALVVLFGQPTDPAAFMDYLITTHEPIAARIPGVQTVTFHSSLVAEEGDPAEFFLIVTVQFANQDDLETAIASEEGQATAADLPNFASGGFTLLLAHVESMPGGATSSPEASPTS
jgi:uncharacterized protein (TIGR02118 family)